MAHRPLRAIVPGGAAGAGAGFSAIGFGFGMGVALSLIGQIGEQADYLRFMPEKTAENKRSWWAAVLAAGPGWVILGAAKQIGGALLAFLALGVVGAVIAALLINWRITVLVPMTLAVVSLLYLNVRDLLRR